MSAREAEVLAALGEHLTDAEIGARQFIWIRTVESHVSSLLRKLQAEDRRAGCGCAESARRSGGRIGRGSRLLSRCRRR
jgi:DNA-binding NarL/FixJ family response regulator